MIHMLDCSFSLAGSVVYMYVFQTIVKLKQEQLYAVYISAS